MVVALVLELDLVTVSMVGPAVQAMVDRDHYYGAPVGGATAYFTGYSDSETWDAQVAGLKQAVATHAPDATVMTMGRQVTGTPAGKAAASSPLPKPEAPYSRVRPSKMYGATSWHMAIAPYAKHAWQR